jgi:hypothetical protein
MAITFNELSTANRNEVVDLITKREAVDSALADLQTERALQETARVMKEQELNAEKNLITETMRKMRKATQT